MIIPQGLDPVIVRDAMDALARDSNFGILCDCMRANDVALLDKAILSGENHETGKKMTTAETEEFRYRRAVFLELMDMPKTIKRTMEVELTEKETPTEVYD